MTLDRSYNCLSLSFPMFKPGVALPTLEKGPSGMEGGKVLENTSGLPQARRERWRSCIGGPSHFLGVGVVTRRSRGSVSTGSCGHEKQS
jgi:hypothetical protein